MNNYVLLAACILFGVLLRRSGRLPANAAASLNGKIFVFGGESKLGTHNQTESYDPATNSWSSWASMPTARHGLGAVVVGQSIYVISGGPKPGATFSAVNEVFTLK